MESDVESDTAPTPRRRQRGIVYAIVSVGIWSNPKILKAGPLGALVFIHALTKNAEHGRLGVFPASEFEGWYLSRVLGLSGTEADAARAAAISAELVAEDGEQIHIVGWSEEWKRADLTMAETERKRRYRLKISTDAVIRNPERKKRSRSEKSRVEETGTRPGQTRDTATKRATQLPDNWIPDRDSIPNQVAEQEAKARGVSLRAELVKLRDWAKAGGKTGKDWDARWRNWIREAAARQGRHGPNGVVSGGLLAMARGEES